MFCDFECQSKFNGSVHTICSAYLCDSYGHAHLINKRAKPFFLSSHHLFIILCNLLFLLVKSLRVLSVSCLKLRRSADIDQISHSYTSMVPLWYMILCACTCVCRFQFVFDQYIFSHFFNERRKKKLEKALNSLNS